MVVLGTPVPQAPDRLRRLPRAVSLAVAAWSPPRPVQASALGPAGYH
jgi:hypothetical protein